MKQGSVVDEIELVIFDCDGVLVDSETISASVIVDLLSEFGVAVSRSYVFDHFIGLSFPAVGMRIRDDWAVSLPAEFEQTYRARLISRFESELQTTPGIRSVLARLRCRACVATSSSDPRVRRTLALTGLDRWFGANVFTASQVARGKPAPDLFLYAAGRMGVSPARTLVIEDSLPGVEAARAAGMTVMVYSGGSHMRGRAAITADVATIDDWAAFPVALLEDGLQEAMQGAAR